jgi:hypothetical protein
MGLSCCVNDWQFMLFLIFQFFVFPILGKPKNRFEEKPIFIGLPINHRPAYFSVLF